VSQKHAFTIVELLVVIAVIAILAAILLPVLSAAKARAQRTVCLNNLRQIAAVVRMYADDSNDVAPRTPAPTDSFTTIVEGLTAFKKLMDNSSNSNLFICPADIFYYDFETNAGGGYVSYVPQGFYEQSISGHSSYGFNSGRTDIFGTNALGIAGSKLSSIKEPVKTVLVAETSAYFPWSWHEPNRSFGPISNDSKNVVSFVDGHVNYIKIYSNINKPNWATMFYNPPAGYDYQWSPN
jgi:prepilin-type N-terminal cleavage/methylation domain-containing protein